MVVAPAAVAMVWKWLFNAEYGIINIVLGALHLPSKIQWISDPKTALLACAIVTIWSSVGYDAILLLSGLQSISKSYYEAARIDGANSFQQFKSITIPLVSPTLFFVLMMRVMASLKVFDIVYMMIEKTNPAIRSCETILYNFYQETFVKNKQRLWISRTYQSASVRLDRHQSTEEVLSDTSYKNPSEQVEDQIQKAIGE